MATIFVHVQPGTETLDTERFKLPAQIRVVGEPLQVTHERLVELTDSTYATRVDEDHDIIHVEIPGSALASVHLLVSQRIGGVGAHASTCDVTTREAHDAG